MNVISFLSQKGGSGKTTLAVHLAVAAEDSGMRVAVLDCDPQASATAWSDERLKAGRLEPHVVQVHTSELPTAVDGARNDGYSLVVIDAAPHANASAVDVAKASDLIIIPVRPTAFDLAALPATMKIIGDRPAAFVLSACPPRAPEIHEAHEVLLAYGRPVLAQVTERRAMFRALAGGLAVGEFDPGGAAALEICQLHTAITEALCPRLPA
jgi:chromosome partitioning protein